MSALVSSLLVKPKAISLPAVVTDWITVASMVVIQIAVVAAVTPAAISLWRVLTCPC